MHLEEASVRRHPPSFSILILRLEFLPLGSQLCFALSDDLNIEYFLIKLLPICMLLEMCINMYTYFSCFLLIIKLMITYIHIYKYTHTHIYISYTPCLVYKSFILHASSLEKLLILLYRKHLICYNYFSLRFSFFSVCVYFKSDSRDQRDGSKVRGPSFGDSTSVGGSTAQNSRAGQMVSSGFCVHHMHVCIQTDIYM